MSDVSDPNPDIDSPTVESQGIGRMRRSPETLELHQSTAVGRAADQHRLPVRVGVVEREAHLESVAVR